MSLNITLACSHPRLVHVINTEDGGINSKIYLCDVCHRLLKVEISFDTISVSYGKPGDGK